MFVYLNVYISITRFLLYGHSYLEGFNSRCRYYPTMVNVVNTLHLHTGDDWTLVLPPWGRIKHWTLRQGQPYGKIPWSQFFDVEGFSRVVPVIEFEDYLKGEWMGDVPGGVLRIFLGRDVPRGKWKLTHTSKFWPKIGPIHVPKIKTKSQILRIFCKICVKKYDLLIYQN